MKWKPYKKYKNSGVSWVGIIPEHWSEQKLKFIAKVNPSNVDKDTNEGEQSVCLCNYNDVYNNEYIHSEMNLMRATASPAEIAKFQLKPGDVLVTKDSEEWSDIAVPAYVVSSMNDTLCGYHLAQVRPLNSNILGEYLFRAFSARGINDQFRVEASGITRYGLGKYSLDSGLFPVPPLNEQHSIVKLLNRQTMLIDNLIVKKQQQIELLQEKRSALISHAVTKGLNPDVKMKDSRVEWLGEIPECWEIKKIKQIGRIKYGLGEPPRSLDSGIPIIRATDISNGKVNMNAVQRIDPDDVPWSRDPVLKINDILVVRSGAYTGDSAIIKPEVAGAIAGYDMVLRVVEAVPQFIAYSLLSKYLLQGQIYLEKMRAAQPHLNAEELGNCIILMPPKTEQEEIVSYLNQEIPKNEMLLELIGKSIERLREYRSALISAAVTGKIDVRQEV